MTDTAPASPRVLIEVDAQYVHAVLDFIARLGDGKSEPAATQPAAQLATDDGFEWTQAEITHIAATFPYVELGTLLDEIAAHAGQWVLKRQVEEDLGLNPNALKSQLTGFTKRYTYPEKEHWPFDSRKTNGLWSYRMRHDVADWWTTGRASA